MEPITLSISSKYAQNWGLTEALRELIANGIDREVEGRHVSEGKFHLSFKNGIVRLVNERTVLTTDKLVLGQSANRDNHEAIGQFGEGLKLAIMVLARRGNPVTIDTGWERWTPVLEASDTFNGAEVLKVKRRKLREERFDLEIQVADVEEWEYKRVNDLFLNLNPTFDSDFAVQGSPFKRERVLLQEEFRGKIYVKGVFVQTRQDTSFGYDLDVDLNRDRSIIDEYTLKDEVADLLGRACQYDTTKFAETLFPALFSDDDKMETDSEWSNLKYVVPFQKMIMEEWDRRYGADVLPVRSSELESVQRLGLKGVVVSGLVRSVVSQVYGDVNRRMKEAETRVVEIVEPIEFTKDETANWDAALRIGRYTYPALAFWNMKIVRFGGNGVLYQDNSETDEHFINRICLSDPVSAMKAVARQIAMMSTYAAGDATVAHILAEMCVKQAEMQVKDNVVDLATLRRLILEAS